jgi:hypothetical protein
MSTRTWSRRRFAAALAIAGSLPLVASVAGTPALAASACWVDLLSRRKMVRRFKPDPVDAPGKHCQYAHDRPRPGGDAAHTRSYHDEIRTRAEIACIRRTKTSRRRVFS